MADLKELINDLATLADTAATVLPQASIAGGAARIGSKIIEIIDDLKHHAPDVQSADTLDEAHAKLMAAVTTKASDLSKRLRGD